MSTLATTAGASLVGTLIATFLGGIALSLSVHYLHSFPKDRQIFHALALFLLSLSLGLTAVSCNYIWQVNIAHFGDPVFLAKMTWQITLMFPIASVSCTSLQVFLAHRAWILSGRSRLWAICLSCGVLLSGAALVLSLWFAAWYGRQQLVASVLEQTSLIWAWWALQASGEATVTAGLIYWVIWCPEQLRAESTRLSLIHRFALRAAETNLISIVVQLLVIILFANAEATGFWFATISFSVPTLYCISLTLALLSRASEEATFAFEATRSPRVVRPTAFNPRPVVDKVGINIHNAVNVDVPSDPSSVIEVGWRAPKIQYDANGAVEGGTAIWLDDGSEYEMRKMSGTTEEAQS